jgi:hypothetical protein
MSVTLPLLLRDATDSDIVSGAERCFWAVSEVRVAKTGVEAVFGKRLRGERRRLRSLGRFECSRVRRKWSHDLNSSDEDAIFVFIILGVVEKRANSFFASRVVVTSERDEDGVLSISFVEVVVDEAVIWVSSQKRIGAAIDHRGANFFESGLHGVDCRSKFGEVFGGDFDEFISAVVFALSDDVVARAITDVRLLHETSVVGETETVENDENCADGDDDKTNEDWGSDFASAESAS